MPQRMLLFLLLFFAPFFATVLHTLTFYFSLSCFPSSCSPSWTTLYRLLVSRGFFSHVPDVYVSQGFDWQVVISLQQFLWRPRQPSKGSQKFIRSLGSSHRWLVVSVQTSLFSLDEWLVVKWLFFFPRKLDFVNVKLNFFFYFWSSLMSQCKWLHRWVNEYRFVIRPWFGFKGRPGDGEMSSK